MTSTKGLSRFNFTRWREMAVPYSLCKKSVLSNQRRMLKSSEVAIDLIRYSGVAVEVEHTFLNSLYVCKGCMSRVERAGRELELQFDSPLLLCSQTLKKHTG